MGFFNYQRHAEVAVDASESKHDRAWALRSCCCSVAATARDTVSTNELILALAQRAECRTEVRESGKLVITDRFEAAIELLSRLRATLLVHLREYEASRRSAKSSGKRFPVAPSFSERTLWEIFESAQRSEVAP